MIRPRGDLKTSSSGLFGDIPRREAHCMSAKVFAEKVRSDLRVDKGYLAAPSVDYRYIWDRDTVYASLPDTFLDPGRYAAAIRGLLDISISDEASYRKLEWLIKDPPRCGSADAWRFPHAKHNPDGSETTEPWGHKQYDAYGAKLFAIGDGERRGIGIIRGDDDLRIINLYARFLYACRFWEDPDFGMWEEGDDPSLGLFRYEVHASSIGAVRAGLASVSRFLEAEEKEMTEEAIFLADRTLAGLLPRESQRKEVDLSLLSLVFPYNLVREDLADEIIGLIESRLLGEKGVCRYRGDIFHAFENREAEWPFGLYWLALSHARRGRFGKAADYLRWGDSVCLADDDRPFPELYVGGRYPNDHAPLGWCASMCLMARRAVAGLPF